MLAAAGLGLCVAVLVGFVNSYAHPDHASPGYIPPQVEQIAQPAQPNRAAAAAPIVPRSQPAAPEAPVAAPAPAAEPAPAPAPAARIVVAAVPKPAEPAIKAAKKRVPPTPGGDEGDQHGGHD